MMETKGARKFLLAGIILASLALMAALDYFTGQELVFSCAYLVPVGLTAWWFSRRAMIWVASASGLTSLLVDHFDGYEYSQPWVEYWNAGTCFVISLSLGYVLWRLHQTLIERRFANEELRRMLSELEASTVEIRKLQDGLQTVCAWTNKIKVDEKWITPEEFLVEKLHLNLTHGMSPEAFREMGKSLTSAA